MQNILKWFFLLNKRLYKKVTFLLILVLIPILVISFSFTAQEESGIMTIALAQEADDPMAGKVMEQLMTEASLIRFVPCASPEEARQLIEDGKADAAWIFPDQMEKMVYRFIHTPNRFNAFIKVLERGDSVPLRMTREKLSGTVFSFCSRVFYLDYLRENIPQLDTVSDESLLKHYDDFAKDTKLFEFAYLDGTGASEDLEQTNYLTAPLRGLLSVIVALAGLASAMYYIQDNAVGTFSLVPQQRKSWVEFACQMIAVANTALVMLFTLLLSGLANSLGRECLILVLYCPAVALFCMNIRRLCGKLACFGTILPLLLVVMLVICPIFLSLRMPIFLQYLFPSTYYINALHSDVHLLLLGIYNAVLWLIYLLSGMLLHRN